MWKTRTQHIVPFQQAIYRIDTIYYIRRLPARIPIRKQRAGDCDRQRLLVRSAHRAAALPCRSQNHIRVHARKVADPRRVVARKSETNGRRARRCSRTRDRRSLKSSVRNGQLKRPLAPVSMFPGVVGEKRVKPYR